MIVMLKRSPKHIGLSGAAERLGNVISVARTSIDANTDTDSVLFSAPKGTFVYDVVLYVKSAFNASTTIKVGDTDDDGFITNTNAAGNTPGVKRMRTDTTAAYYNGRYYAEDDVIKGTFSFADTSGLAEILIFYVPAA